MTEEEREEWPALQHGDCIHFSVNSDREESTCRRLDHKHLIFAQSPFKAYDCGQMQGLVCKEFEPKKICRWLYEHWDGIYGYFGEDFKLKGLVWLIVDGDESVRYGVAYEDFWDGTFLNPDGTLKWVEKMYYRRTKKEFGYKLVRERREDGRLDQQSMAFS